MTEQNKQGGATLRQSENKIELEGLLIEKDIHEGVTQKGSEYLSLKLTIETDKDSHHIVESFSTKTKADGSENGLYKGLRTVVDEYKSVNDVGREEADTVRVNNGELRVNDYVGGDGQLRSFPQFSAIFVNRVEDVSQSIPHAKFEVEVVVDKVLEEIKDDEETGRVVLHGYVAMYGGKVAPFEFKVAKDGAGYVMDNYEKGDTVFVYGNIINQYEKIITKTESAFGEDKEDVKHFSTRELEITGGTEPYDEESPKAYDTSLIAQALNEREVYLEGLKEKKKNAKQSSGARKPGFDVGAKKESVTISSEDLPF